MSASLTGLIKSRTTLYVAGALIVGVLGGKMLWVDAGPAIRVPIASAKPAAKKSATKPTAQRPTAGQRAPVAPQDPRTARPVQPALEAPPAQAPTFAPTERQVYLPPPAPRHTQPADIDASSDTEGLFLIASLKDGQGAEAPPPQPAAPSPTVSGDIVNNALAERVVTAANPAAALTDGLGPVFVDDSNGYYMRFPAGWSIRRFDGEPWVVECGDGRSALISVGFSGFPSEYTADNIPLDWVARRIKKRSDTALNAQGYATIMGRKAIWSKSTGPMQVGQKQVKVVRTTYIVPLGDGRVAEIRIAAAPEQFEKIAGVMKNAVSTFRLIRKADDAEQFMAKTE